MVNGRPALRVGDTGIHAACCGPNMWTAQSGAPSVFINGKAAFRMNDPSLHCGGTGQLCEGSANVIVGDSGGGAGAGGGGSSGGAAGSGGGGGGASSSSGGGGGNGNAGGGAAPSPVESKHWIEIELHTDSGEPMAGARYRIRKPDGSAAEGTLDGAGRARLDGLEPGTCQVSFPDIDKGEWRRV
jgi:hypothetical protein